jgi:hypothetical protein
LSPYTAAAGRKFGLTVGIAFGVFAGIAFWRGHPTTAGVLGSIGGLLVLAGLIVPTTLGPVDRAWMKLALLISKITTPVFMGILYYLVLTPAGLLRRAISSNPIVHRPGPFGVWLDRSAHPRGSLERLF